MLKNMRRTIFTLISLCCLILPCHLQATTIELPIVSIDEMPQSQMSREKYLTARLEAIAKNAFLTNEEKEWVGEQLTKYDKIRFQSWAETRKVYKEMDKLGDKATPEQYLECFSRLQHFTAQRHKASQDFMSLLIDRLTPEKAFKVYKSYRDFNANAGRKLRGK